MADIHEYNKMVGRIQQFASDTYHKDNVNIRVYYTIVWRVAERIKIAKEYIRRQTDFCCQEHIRLLSLADESWGALWLLALIPEDLYFDVQKFLNKEIEASRKAKEAKNNG